MRSWLRALAVAATVVVLAGATVGCSKKNKADDDSAATTTSIGTNDTSISPVGTGDGSSGGGGGDASTSTTNGPVPSPAPGPGPAPSCPDIPVPAGPVDLTTGTGDYNGSGGADTLYVYNAGNGTWVLLVQFAGGGAAQASVNSAELFAGGAAALNGGDIDQNGKDEVFAREGAGAYAAIIGVHEVVGCALVPVVPGGSPALLPVGASVGSISGAQCGGGDGGASALFLAEGGSVDGSTYDIVTREHRLNGTVLDEIPPPIETTAQLGDEGYVAASSFSCYTVSYVP